MIDIHHHLLPGIDDGAKDFATAVAMVEMAVADGITHIVATSHANHTYTFDRARNEALLEELRGKLPMDTAARVRLGLGCDFHLSWENTQDAHTHPRRYTINETEYLLIELPEIGIPNRLGELLYTMRLDGLTPILTHPERNSTLQREPDRLREWVRDGLLLQITAGSLTGNFGSQAESLAWQLLENRWAHFLATDAHDTQRRPPQMSAARLRVATRLGEQDAERLCVTNPLAVFEGKPLPEQPSPVALNEPLRKPSLWRRLFGH